MLYVVAHLSEQTAVITSRLRSLVAFSLSPPPILPIGHVPLENIQEAEFVGKVYIGSPPRPYTVVFDTGSANLWVLSKEGTHVPSGKGAYVHDRSSTYQPNGKTMNIKYGSGFVEGFYSNDQVQAGGLSIPQMAFGEATLAMDNEHGTLFSGMQGEGILGLAFQGISEHAVPTFLDLLYQEKQIDKKIFSFYHTRNVKRHGSRMILGGVDMSFAREKEFKYVPLVGDGFWVVGMAQLELRRGGGERGREGGREGGSEGEGIPPMRAGTMMTAAAAVTVDTAATSSGNRSSRGNSRSGSNLGGSSRSSIRSNSSSRSSIRSSDNSYSNNTLKLCAGQANCLAIVDTGTSFLGIPQTKLPAMLEFITHGHKNCLVQKSKLTVCDCDRAMSGFPDIEIHLHADLASLPLSSTLRRRHVARLPAGEGAGGGQGVGGKGEIVTLRLAPEDYLLQFYSDFKYKCAIGLQGVHSNLMGRDDDVYILGTTVLKTYYTVFDAEKMQVGFAYTADEKEPPSKAGPVIAVLYRLTSLALYVVILVCLVRISQDSAKSEEEGEEGEEGESV
ncbi:aspartic proteinase [Nannochloropsis oceanica]